MATPYLGTIQHPDIESLIVYRPPKRQCPYDLQLPLILLEINVASCIHTITCCALGRFMLDHFHLWRSTWIIPSDAPGIEKHAELIAALLAGSLAGPGLYGGGHVADAMISAELDKRFRDLRRRTRIPIGNIPLWGVYFLILWALLAITGAVLHPRFHYLTAGSILGVYGFGALFLFLPSFGLALFVIERRFLISSWLF
ncbi:hypothetical protein DL96DRAFT_1643301 [Flagelloscypha sp. PMI_526]|nr:hypothetical protein DL96DRAFT_1643301 [Flagelloscypha sp. PMI_526]